MLFSEAGVIQNRTYHQIGVTSEMAAQEEEVNCVDNHRQHLEH